MTRSRTEADFATPGRKPGVAVGGKEATSETYDPELSDAFDSVLDAESDFDVEDDVAFYTEEYDVLDLDDVLELCKVSSQDTN